MLNKKGQNTAEYAILIALVIAAAVGMQTYVKRGWQGRMKDTSDDFVKGVQNASEWSAISNVSSGTADKQFEPTQFSKKATQDTLEDKTKSTMEQDGTVTRDITRRTQQAAGDYQKYGR